MNYIAGNLSRTMNGDKAFSLNFYNGSNTFNDFGDSIFDLGAELCS